MLLLYHAPAQCFLPIAKVFLAGGGPSSSEGLGDPPTPAEDHHHQQKKYFSWQPADWLAGRPASQPASRQGSVSPQSNTYVSILCCRRSILGPFWCNFGQKTLRNASVSHAKWPKNLTKRKRFACETAPTASVIMILLWLFLCVSMILLCFHCAFPMLSLCLPYAFPCSENWTRTCCSVGPTSQSASWLVGWLAGWLALGRILFFFLSCCCSNMLAPPGAVQSQTNQPT